MTRETKIGLVVAASFLCLVGVVVASKWNGAAGTEEEQTVVPGTVLTQNKDGKSEPKKETAPPKPNVVAAAQKKNGSGERKVDPPAKKSTTPPLQIPGGISLPSPAEEKAIEDAKERQRKEDLAALEKLKLAMNNDQNPTIPLPSPGALPADLKNLPLPQPTGGGDLKPLPLPQPSGGGDLKPLPLPQPVGGSDLKPLPQPIGGGDLKPLPQPQPIGGGDLKPLPQPQPIGGGDLKPLPQPIGGGDLKPLPQPQPIGGGDLKPLPSPMPMPSPVPMPPTLIDTPKPFSDPAPIPQPRPDPFEVQPKKIDSLPVPPRPGNDPIPFPQKNPGPIATIPPNGGTSLPTVPPITIGGNRPGSNVKDSNVDFHEVKQGQSNFAILSTQLYGTDKYADALLKYNRDHSFMIKNGSLLNINPPPLSPGQQVLKPSASLLERDYAGVIKAAPTPPRILETPQPLTPGSITPVSASPTGGVYTVQNPNGESILDIAQRVLGDRSQWHRIYRVNPGYQPQNMIPAGTKLTIPGS
jgi:hypothetical protein